MLAIYPMLYAVFTAVGFVFQRFLLLSLFKCKDAVFTFVFTVSLRLSLQRIAPSLRCLYPNFHFQIYFSKAIFINFRKEKILVHKLLSCSFKVISGCLFELQFGDSSREKRLAS